MSSTQTSPVQCSVLSEALETAKAICEVATKAFEKFEKEEGKTITVEGEEVALGDLDVDDGNSSLLLYKQHSSHQISPFQPL